VTEGAVALQIEATPVPPNDAFADASVLAGNVEEEPGEPPFYFAATQGYNWGAGKELGEPGHAGDPGGASVWYTWTAPATGSARLSAQGNWFEPLLAIYGGDSLNALTPLASSASSGIEGVPVTVGQTYWIAVDGTHSSESGEADTASFVLMLTMQLPAGFGQQGSSPGPGSQVLTADTTPPDTRIVKRTLKRMPPIWSFRFASTEPGSTFRCKLDKQSFHDCRSPLRLSSYRPSRHILRVVAVDVAGNVDPSAAVARFNGAARPSARR
jgi:hypothetical protein